MRRNFVRVTAGLLLAVAGACSSGDDDAASTSSASTAESTLAPVAGSDDDTSNDTSDGSSNDTGDGSSDVRPGTTSPATATSVTPPTDAVDTTSPVTTADASPSTSQPTSASTPAPSTTIERTADELGDLQLAESALVELASFPDGWTSEPATESPENEKFEAEFDACLGRSSDSPTEALSRRQASSDEFIGTGDNRPTVEHSVSMAADEDLALLAMSEVATEGASDCIADVVQEFFETEFAADSDVPDGLTLGRIEVERIDDGAQPDVVVWYRLTIPISVEDLDVAQYLDVVYQRAGRAISNLQFASFATPFDPEGIDALAIEVEEKITRIGVGGN